MSPTAPLILIASQLAGENDYYTPNGGFPLHFEPRTGEDDCACADAPILGVPIKEGENDCAWTPSLMPKVYKSNFTGNDYRQTPDLFSMPLFHGFHLVISSFAPDGPIVLNQPAWERWQAFAVSHPLVDRTDRILAQQKLIQPADSRLVWQQPQPQILTAWLHVTNACDLECPYCYVRKSSARMSEDIGRKALKAVFDTAVSRKFRQVKLKYAGGEATLHFKMIRSLHALAQKYSDETGIGLSAVVLTNGANLRSDDVDWLKENNVRLMVSLDGVGEAHDQLRHRKGGSGTFDRIAYTIDHLLLPRGIRPYITMTVSNVNAYAAADLAQWAIVERQLPVNFNLYRQNILSDSREELVLEEETIINGLKAAYTVVEQSLPDKPILGGLLDRVQTAAHTHTCGVGKNYVVITHTGQLAECHMRLDEATPLSSDLLASSQLRIIQNLTVDEKEECSACVFRYRCTGGCPLETYRATGRWDVKSPHCRIYKTLLPEMLRLQGLQLLKANNLLETVD